MFEKYCFSDGHKLLHYIAQREARRLSRCTVKDEILNTYRFTNVNRQLDSGSIYFVQVFCKKIARELQTTKELSLKSMALIIFNSAMYRSVICLKLEVMTYCIICHYDIGFLVQKNSEMKFNSLTNIMKKFFSMQQ